MNFLKQFFPQYLKIICGPMFAGKTEHLIKEILKFQSQNKQIICFKPQIDNRNQNNFYSRNGLIFPAINIQNSNEIIHHILNAETRFKHKIDIVCFDETHFFDLEIISVFKKLLKDKKMIICAGLHKGFSERKLPVISMIRKIADEEIFLKATCFICNAPATKTQRLNSNRQPINPIKILDQQLVGGSETYEARCDKHFTKV